MSNYQAQIDALLRPLMLEAAEAGESNMLMLSQALAIKAREVSDFRSQMIVEPDFHCRDCGRHWTTPLTVARARDCTPENCPRCYNKSGRGISGHTGTFRYIDKR